MTDHSVAASKNGTLRSRESAAASNNRANRVVVKATVEKKSGRAGSLGIVVEPKRREANDYALHTQEVYKCFLGGVPGGSKLVKEAYKAMVKELSFKEKARVVAYTWYRQDERPLCTTGIYNAVKHVALHPK